MMDFKSHVGYQSDEKSIGSYKEETSTCLLLDLSFRLLFDICTIVKSASSHHLGESFLHVPSVKQSQIQENLVKLWDKLPIVNYGINYQPQLVSLPEFNEVFVVSF